jgi:RNA polymerase sigma-70 factor (ECF subfamily)
MSPDDSFVALMERVRARDGQAAADLIRLYEPAVRRVVRIQMRDPRLRRTLDSMDICQSIFGSFFVRVALGQFELNTPDDLRKLLAVMARNKVVTQARRPHVQRQQERQLDNGDSGAVGMPASPEPSPSHQAEARDLLEQVRGRLTEEERWLADQRAQGRPWAEIAAERGGSQEALRKKLERALDRVAQELGLEESADE